MKNAVMRGLVGVMVVGIAAPGFGLAAAAPVSTPVKTQVAPVLSTVAPVEVQNVPNFTVDLYVGVRNNSQVSDLQNFLTDQGFYAGPVTGNFFSLTLQAVKKFQSANGVRPTGYFGPKSRGVANKIIQELVKVVCPSEEGCASDVWPRQELVITTKSDLHGTVGSRADFAFSVSGGDGTYTIDGDGTVPGLLWANAYGCEGVTAPYPCDQIALRDSIMLRGVPTKAGTYNVTVVAREVPLSVVCPEGAACSPARPPKYGKQTFTIVITDPSRGGSAPAIKGVKGPTKLSVGEEGTWSVQASDPQNGSLSYSVTWGDEVYALPMKDSSGSVARPYIQTATFAHTYRTAGEFTPVFRVVNDRGLEAKTSVSVLVGASTRIGTLSIDPASITLDVGGTARVEAYYQAPMPPCKSDVCPMMMPTHIVVGAHWEISNTGIAKVSYAFPECAAPPPDAPPGYCMTQVFITGVSSGAAELVASYTPSGGQTVVAVAKVVVRKTGTNSPITILSPNAGATWKIGGSYLIAFSWQNWNDSDYPVVFLEQYHPLESAKAGNVNSSNRIFTGAVSSGGQSFVYTVPDGTQYANTYRIEVCNSTCSIATESSGYFSIVGPVTTQ